ncbi:META domain-containing protein [Coralliovum pocilloporae]|uniref:META domain-containing protein n=1 Tax=Coralliovum pocilloporae TaxID=3066369 RepID=UPI00330755A7
MKKSVGLMAVWLLAVTAAAGLLTETGEASGKASKLDGTRWVFEANSLVDVWVEATGKEPLTLEFHDGRMNGYAGCNSFFGSYKQKGQTLSFGPIGSTRMLCEGDRQHQEDVILEALERVSSFEINGALLRLNTGGGTALVYRKDPRDGAVIDHGGLHTFETCKFAGGALNGAKTTCRIDDRLYHKE